MRDLGLDEETVEKYRRAGEIARRVREEARRTARPGMRLVDLAEFVERRIREYGGEPAFPVNLSLNDVAAHYTPVAGDSIVISESSVLKIDIGVHVDGYIADTAATVCFNPAYEPLVEAAEEALRRAIDEVAPGVPVSRIGRVIEETIVSRGFRPIRNLTGHSLDRYVIHAGLSIPNYWERRVNWRLTEGAYAIEPFATTGVGWVRESNIVTIFSLRPGALKARLSPPTRKIVDSLWRERRGLPFCERWILGYSRSVGGARMVIAELIRRGAVNTYPMLVEKKGGAVSQFEHTMVIHGKDVIVTTL